MGGFSQEGYEGVAEQGNGGDVGVEDGVVCGAEGGRVVGWGAGDAGVVD